MSSAGRRAVLSLLGIAAVLGCQSDRLIRPDEESPLRELAGVAVRIRVDLEQGTVRMLPRKDLPRNGGDLNFAIVGANEVIVTTTNLVRSLPVNNKVTVTFDAAITNRLTSASLIPPSFPGTATGLLLFPYQVTNAVGGNASLIEPSTDWNGDGSAGSGAPRNFFNDFSCSSNSAGSDCLRWEQYPAPLAPGETTAPQKVGFVLPKAITSFDVLLILSADIGNDLPPVARIEVTPETYVMNDGFPKVFSAVAYDALNNPLTWVTLKWTTADITALEFQHGGALVGVILGPNQTVHGRKVGQTSFTVSSGGVSRVVPVDIQVNTVALVQLFAPSTMTEGDQAQGDARVKDHSGLIIPGLSPTWSTTDPTVLGVNQNGLIMAVGAGTADVIAAAGLASGRVTITVSPLPPGSVTGQITRVQLDSEGGTIVVPMDGVGVTIGAQSGTSGPGGNFTITGIKPGSYQMSIQNLDKVNGCNMTPTIVAVTSNNTTTLDLALSCVGTVNGFLLSPQGAAAAIDVYAETPTGVPFKIATTDNFGQFTATLLPGTYYLSPGPSGCAFTQNFAIWTVEWNKTTSGNVPMDCTAAVVQVTIPILAITEFGDGVPHGAFVGVSGPTFASTTVGSTAIVFGLLPGSYTAVGGTTTFIGPTSAPIFCASTSTAFAVSWGQATATAPTLTWECRNLGPRGLKAPNPRAPRFGTPAVTRVKTGIAPSAVSPPPRGAIRR